MMFLLLEGTAVLAWRDLRRLMAAGLAGLVLTGVHAGLPDQFMFLRLTDNGPIQENIALTLLVQAIGGPMAAMWFAKDLGHTPLAVVRRIVHFSLISLVFWWMAVEAGRAVWWGPLAHWVVCLVWYSVVWAVHAYCQGWLRRTRQDTYDV